MVDFVFLLMEITYLNPVKKSILFTLLVLLSCKVNAQIFKDKYIKDATKVANTWLDNINSKNYATAYSDLSILFKENNDSTKWLQAVRILMNEFGSFEKREIIYQEFKNNIENLGDGFYVFLEYKSYYKNLPNCSENLILHQNDKLIWKVLDYKYWHDSQEFAPEEKSPN